MLKTLSNKDEILKHFTALFEYATIGIVLTDSDGYIIAINPFALKEFGYSQEDLIGEKIEILIPHRYHDKYIHLKKKYVENPQIREMDLFGLKKDGIEFPAEISLGHYTSNGNNYVIALISDISARKASESEVEKLNAVLENTVMERTKDLKKAMMRLEKSNSELENVLSFKKVLLDAAGVMIIVTDENGIITLFNPEAALMLGYSQDEILDKVTPLLFHNEKDIERRRRQLYDEFHIKIESNFDVLVEKARHNIHEEEQYDYVKKTGESFPVSLTVTALRNATGDVTGFMAIAVDISERIKAEKDLREDLKIERDLNELKSRFVSMASHEFRTPLSTVLSSAYLIEKYTSVEDQPKREKHLQRIVSSVNMLTDILNDFLSLGKIEEGKLQVKFSEFNLHEMINTTIDEIKNNLKRNQQIHYIHEGNPIVFLDPSMLKHIIMNLVSNASKFSSDNSPIDIKTMIEDGHTLLSVRDKGIGISTEDQKHLMERFFRAANAQNIQGTGLGLPIISKYAEMMNGNLHCKSELGKGTEFLVEFKTSNF